MKKYIRLLVIASIWATLLTSCAGEDAAEENLGNDSESMSATTEQDSEDQKITLENMADEVIDLEDVEMQQLKDMEFTLYEPGTKETENFLKERNIKIDKKEYKIEYQGEEFGDTYQKENYYVVLFHNKYGNFDTKLEIARVNLETNEQEIFYTYDNKEKPIFISELESNDDYLFWEEFDQDQNWEIKKMSLKDKNIETIRTSQEGLTMADVEPILTANDNGLFWIEKKAKADGDSKYMVMYYDISEDKSKAVAKDVYVSSPYARISVDDDMIAYKMKVDGRFAIKRLNIKTGESDAIVLPIETLEPEYIRNTKEATSWLYHGEDEIYVYNRNNNTFTRFADEIKFANHETIEFNPFLNELIRDNVVWRDGTYLDNGFEEEEMSNQYNYNVSDIYICDLEDKIIAGIIDTRENGRWSHYMNSPNTKKEHIIRDSKEDAIYILSEIETNREKLSRTIEEQIRAELENDEQFKMQVEDLGEQSGERYIKSKVEHELNRREKEN